MKKILLATIATLAMCGVAAAADLSTRMPVKAPPVYAPVFSWTGCYVGAYVGAAWADNYTATDSYYLNNWSYKNDASFTGGGTVGCNWQPVGSPFVLGLEGELGYLNLEGSAYAPWLTTLAATSKVGDWYGMITGRLGYSFDRAMIYVKGGAAFVNAEASIYSTVTGVGLSASETVTTWTIGGGLEYALDMNWSVKAEYMYIGMNDTLQTCGYYVRVGVYGCSSHDLPGISTAKIGVNYRFGGGAPVVARY
jgi:outer membrane immunogenic protein